MVNRLSQIVNMLPFNNKRKINHRNSIKNNGLSIKSNYIIKGTNNKITISNLTRLINCTIDISGCNNEISIGEGVYLENVELHIEDDNGKIIIGDKTIVSGMTHLAVIEGTSIEIGKDCLFSSNITIRTGDSHSIIDCVTEKRINASKSVKVGDHVWLANGSTILKGVSIECDCVVATKSVVTKSLGQTNCVLGGNPARILKSNVSWLAKRVKMEGK